ncbi:MFS transporter [Streptomyces sp. ISL-22]|uniref:MFS transporter n=1 Tax=unclassified Streptomyces TaxID=2593676 RepID=UPI001BE5DFC2|nr:MULTISPECIES: MFS transporter [unclassified Streptomyces]MBT2420720.1 MFS transporter [Streptomyces sp. ISL-24]MBT2437650.1 MFS transporter [Streptomyces sp. ISL-22]
MAVGPGTAERPGVGERGVIALVYLAGVSAGVALGRFVPLEAGVRDAFGLSLAAYGLLVSGVTVVAACLALPTGLWIVRRDLGRVLSAGLGVMLLGGLLEVAAPVGWVLYGARALEGVGYLAVVVTGPMLLAARCRPATESRALALWSTFVPVGMAVASALGTLSGTVGWRAAGALTLVPGAVGLMGALRWLTGICGRPEERYVPHRRGLGPLLQLSLAFSLVALLGVTVVALLPKLAADREVRSAVGGATAAVVSLAGVPGGLLAGWLLGRGAGPRALAATAILGLPGAAAVTYQVDAWAVVSASAAVLQFAGGFVLAALYASVPSVARSPYELGRGYGLLNQAGSVGTLLGPPAFGIAVTRGGWASATVLAAVVTLGGLILFLAATRRPEPSGP